MLNGIFFALAACFVWGLIFVVPEFMAGFSAIEIVLGRYAVYGFISILFFAKTWSAGKCRYPRAIWIKAIKFSLASTLVYYIFLVLALRYAMPSVVALIMGVTPITIAFYGNFRQHETSYKSLMVPSILILIGLAFINIPYFQSNPSNERYLLGLFFSLISLATWSWYVVANARFLKEHNHVHASDWSTMIGVSTLCWVILTTAFLLIFVKNQIRIEQYQTYGEALQRFLIGSAILGILCSWVGAFLWNKASRYLPVSLAGQLTIFETIFGVTFVYIVEQRVPSPMETTGIIILLAAIIYGTHHFTKRLSKGISPH